MGDGLREFLVFVRLQGFLGLGVNVGDLSHIAQRGDGQVIPHAQAQLARHVGGDHAFGIRAVPEEGVHGADLAFLHLLLQLGVRIQNARAHHRVEARELGVIVRLHGDELHGGIPPAELGKGIAG